MRPPCMCAFAGPAPILLWKHFAETDSCSVQASWNRQTAHCTLAYMYGLLARLAPSSETTSAPWNGVQRRPKSPGQGFQLHWTAALSAAHRRFHANSATARTHLGCSGLPAPSQHAEWTPNHQDEPKPRSRLGLASAVTQYSSRSLHTVQRQIRFTMPPRTKAARLLPPRQELSTSSVPGRLPSGMRLIKACRSEHLPVFLIPQTYHSSTNI